RLSAIDVLEEGERDRLDGWGHRAVLGRSVVEHSVAGLFAAQVARVPAAVALGCAGRSWTYRQLDEASNRLAHFLIDHGAGPGQCVALLVPRSAEAIIAILAVLKTGAAYLPIDPALPDERIDFVLGDAAPIAVLTTSELRQRLGGRDFTVVDIADPAIDTRPDTALPDPGAEQVAHIIYTSGTTGVPKGVAVTHHNITRLFDTL
ncbi:AMP-binding protein, partial [Mycobacterium sp. ACS4054]|uniref:AMP-binding protein n=1 Tax=Mycobacterium sp. ACS4054 TaxID=1834119 RepID=UPI000A79224E